MIPYYKEDNCTIYNADCIDLLQSLDRFDLLLTEAPKYPPGLSDDNKVRMESGLKMAAQSTRIDALPEAGLLMAISMAENAIVWRPNRYALPSGYPLAWGCNGHIAIAWANIPDPQLQYWCPIPKSERLRLFRQCTYLPRQVNTILDPFMATGDVLIAAISLRKTFVGIEVDSQRCDEAVRRIQRFKKARA